MADDMLKFMQEVAGDDSLAFEEPDRVSVRFGASEETWAEVETKTTESLKVTLAGPASSVDLEELVKLSIESPVDSSDESTVRVTLNFTKPQQLQSNEIKSYIMNHFKSAK